MHGQICYEGQCEFPGTLKQEANSTCTCKPEYSGPQCEQCAKGLPLVDGFCASTCKSGYYLYESSCYGK